MQMTELQFGLTLPSLLHKRLTFSATGSYKINQRNWNNLCASRTQVLQQTSRTSSFRPWLVFSEQYHYDTTSCTLHALLSGRSSSYAFLNTSANRCCTKTIFQTKDEPSKHTNKEVQQCQIQECSLVMAGHLVCDTPESVAMLSR